MSSKCIIEILGKAKKLGVDFTEREAGEMFRRIREKELRHERELSDPQMFLLDEARTEKETALHGEDLRRKLKTLSPEGRLTEYGRMAFDDMVLEKKEALRRRYLQVQKNVELEEKVRFTDQTTHIKALNEVTFKTEAKKNALITMDMADLSPAIDKYLGFFGGKITHENALDVVREIVRPGSTKDANAKALADVWMRTREAVRERKNSLGAAIGKLEDWIMPQAWDAQGIRQAGKAVWVEEVLPLLNRAKYWDEATGELLNDVQLREVLSYAWETITTGGLNKPIHATGGRGSLGKRLGDAHRALHFKDPESWYAMATKYGERDIFQLMGKTVVKDAKDVAMLETFGPNPNAGFDAALAHAKNMDATEGKLKSHIVNPEWMAKNYFEELKGGNAVPVNSLVSNFMLGVRQWLVAAKLGGMLLSQMNDIATYAAIARTDGLGMGQAMMIALKSLNPANKADQALARRHGILAQSIINDVAMRFGETTKGTTWTSRLANATVKLSGGEWWTNSMKQAYQVLIGTHVNDFKGIEFDTLDPHFKAMLERYDIGVKDWDVIRRTEAVDLTGERVITPTSVKLSGPDAHNAALKLAEMMNEEADIAIVSPGLKERALIKAGTKPGTFSGEFMRSVALFKTFTVSMTTKVLPRIFNRESLSTSRGAGVAVQFALSMIILGGASYQLKEMSKGRNPVDMFTPGFWGAAAAQSGGLGILGDFFLNDVNRYGGGWTSTVGGPVAGLFEDVGKLTIGNIHQAARGEDVKAGGDAIQFGKNYLPFLNLVYARAAVDHLLLFRLQEAANPGYLRRMKRRVENENNQSHWWNPEDVLPEGAPNLGEAFGGR